MERLLMIKRKSFSFLFVESLIFKPCIPLAVSDEHFPGSVSPQLVFHVGQCVRVVHAVSLVRGTNLMLELQKRNHIILAKLATSQQLNGGSSYFHLLLPSFWSRPKLSYDQTQSSAHPCAPRPKLQGLQSGSSTQ